VVSRKLIRRSSVARMSEAVSGRNEDGWPLACGLRAVYADDDDRGCSTRLENALSPRKHAGYFADHIRFDSRRAAAIGALRPYRGGHAARDVSGARPHRARAAPRANAPFREAVAIKRERLRALRAKRAVERASKRGRSPSPSNPSVLIRQEGRHGKALPAGPPSGGIPDVHQNRTPPAFPRCRR
jgi:hypothetical protein